MFKTRHDHGLPAQVKVEWAPEEVGCFPRTTVRYLSSNLFPPPTQNLSDRFHTPSTVMTPRQAASPPLGYLPPPLRYFNVLWASLDSFE